MGIDIKDNFMKAIFRELEHTMWMDFQWLKEDGEKVNFKVVIV
jgi:hypothetical protein